LRIFLSHQFRLTKLYCATRPNISTFICKQAKLNPLHGFLSLLLFYVKNLKPTTKRKAPPERPCKSPQLSGIFMRRCWAGGGSGYPIFARIRDGSWHCAGLAIPFWVLTCNCIIMQNVIHSHQIKSLMTELTVFIVICIHCIESQRTERAAVAPRKRLGDVGTVTPPGSRANNLR